MQASQCVHRSPGHTRRQAHQSARGSAVLGKSKREDIGKVTVSSRVGGPIMKKWNRGIKSTISLAVLAFGLASFAQANAEPNGQLNQSPTPPGLFITPTALPNANQQVLNPGLALPYFATNYPNFVAGEAVKAVVSPDGKTLAV